MVFHLHLAYLYTSARIESDSINSYHDPNPIFDVCFNIQRYYEQHSYSTRVKACAAVSVEQIIQLAGVAAFTATADQLQELSTMEEPAGKVAARSIFHEATDGYTNGNADGQVSRNTQDHINGSANGNSNGHEAKTMEKMSFIDDESKYRLAFAKSDGGKAQMKTTQVCTYTSFILLILCSHGIRMTRMYLLGSEHFLRVPNQSGSPNEGRGYDKYWISAQRFDRIVSSNSEYSAYVILSLSIAANSISCKQPQMDHQ